MASWMSPKSFQSNEILGSLACADTWKAKGEIIHFRTQPVGNPCKHIPKHRHAPQGSSCKVSWNVIWIMIVKGSLFTTMTWILCFQHRCSINPHLATIARGTSRSGKILDRTPPNSPIRVYRGTKPTIQHCSLTLLSPPLAELFSALSSCFPVFCCCLRIIAQL